MIFLHQSAVLIAGYSFGYFEAKDLLRSGGLTIIFFGVLLLSVLFYWPLIGMDLIPR